MNEVLVDNQPVLNKVLTKINASSSNVQAYILVGSNEDDLKKYSILFTKVLACPNTYTKNCNKCNICARISSKNYGELKIINPINNVIKKESILDLKNSFKTNSIEGKNQVYIINQVDALSSASANSLLKFLEEPDSNTVAIFTTTNLNSVMKTITSRCQVIKLNNRQLLTGIDLIKNITFLDDNQINLIMDFFFSLEKNADRAFASDKNSFLNVFNTRELLKSAMNVLLFLYKDMLNYKIFKKMDYFNNETGIKNASESQTKEKITKKIKFILENINKLEYNVNMTLFINNLIIEIGEI